MATENLSPAQELAALRASAVTAAAELEAANGLLTDAQTQISALTGERDTAKAEVTRLTGELASASTNLSAVTGERDTAQADLAKANAKLANPSMEAAAICASAHVDAPAQMRPGAKAGAVATGEELFAQMGTLPANQQSGFYQQNKKAIDAYVRQRQQANG